MRIASQTSGIGRKALGFVAAAICLATIATASAQTLRQWQGTTSTAFGTNSNWGGNAPTHSNEVATFSSSLSSGVSPTISSSSYTTGGIRIQSSAPSTDINFTGTSGVLTLDPTGWSGTVGID